ncbi:MAG: hypothetical protein ABIT10_11810 [Alteraurantiacibacter sp.]
MKTLTKSLIGTVATLAMAVGSAAPAAAQDRYGDRDRDHVSTGTIVAGALVLGGIAAVAAAANNNRDYNNGDRDYRYGDDDYRDRDYRNGNDDYRDRDYRNDDYRSGGYRNDDYRSGGYRDRNWDGRGQGWYDYRSGRNYGRGGNPERAVSQCIRAAENQAERYGGGRADVTRIRDIDRERGGFEVTGTIQVQQRYGGRGWNSNRRTDTARFYCDYRRGQVTSIDFDGLNTRR